MKNEPNLPRCKVIHFINEQRTMPALPALSTVEGNNEHCSNEPNFKNPQITLTPVEITNYTNFNRFQHQKNEPNLCKTNPIQTQFVLSLSKGYGKTNYEQVTHFINEQRTMNNEHFSNEPNFKNTQINLTSFTAVNYGNFHPLEHRKNEPNTNPILPVVRPTDCCWGLQFCRVCNLFAHAESYSGQALPSSWFPATTAYLYPTANKKMRNEPNLKNAKKTVTNVPGKDYMKNDAFELPKNEPNFKRFACKTPHGEVYDLNIYSRFGFQYLYLKMLSI